MILEYETIHWLTRFSIDPDNLAPWDHELQTTNCQLKMPFFYSYPNLNSPFSIISSVPNMDETMWQIYSLDLEKICAFGFLLFADSYLANCLKISHLLGFSYCNNLFGPFCLPFWTADTKYKVVFTNYVCRHGRYFLRNLIIFCEEVLSWYKRNMHFWCKGNE